MQVLRKENANSDKVEIINTPDMDKYVKAVPAASLTYSDDAEALEAFNTYLDSKAASEIWTKYGYEIIN